MSESDVCRIAVAGAIQPHYVGLGYQLAICAVAATKSPGSATEFLRKILIQVGLGAGHVAVTLTHHVELDNRRSGRKVHVNGRNVLLMIRQQTMEQDLKGKL